MSMSLISQLRALEPGDWIALIALLAKVVSIIDHNDPEADDDGEETNGG